MLRPQPRTKKKSRDPDMLHQTRKGNQWYFGMKAHIGVDSKSKLVHTIVITAENVHDSQVLEDLLHGEKHDSGVIQLMWDMRSYCEVSQYRSWII